MDKIRILELYSGIGGMHFALQESGTDFEVVAAIDINTTANTVYRHNFPRTKLLNRCIESLSLKELDNLQFDMILMSPPCQPFCRVGKQQDMADVRTKSFLSLLEVLPRLPKPPSYILVENVKGFDTSESRNLLLGVLQNMDYNVQEFLVSPLQFGVPNSRLRYYLIAKKKPLKFCFETESCIREDIPRCIDKFLIHRKLADCKYVNSSNTNTCKLSNASNHLLNLSAEAATNENPLSETEKTCSSKNSTPDSKTDSNLEAAKTTHLDKSTCDESVQSLKDTDKCDIQTDQLELPIYEKFKHICGKVGDYLEQETDEYFTDYLIPEKFYKRFWVMDIVTKDSNHCCCFTKRYGHHIDGAGSVIQMNTQSNIDMSEFDGMHSDEAFFEAVKKLKLRFFTPREISNVMCFPQYFSFPEEMTNIQCHRLLGNSLNVHVVAALIKLMTLDEDKK